MLSSLVWDADRQKGGERGGRGIEREGGREREGERERGREGGRGRALEFEHLKDFKLLKRIS